MAGDVGEEGAEEEVWRVDVGEGGRAVGME